MQIKCEKCGNNLSIYVDKKMMQFYIGKITCPKCMKQQSRYISESDLFLYLLLSEVSYLILCAITLLIYNLLNKSLYALFVLVPLLLVNLYLIKIIGRNIYTYAYGKSDFKDHVFCEDSKLVKKSINYRVVIFFTVSVSLLTLNVDNLYTLLFIGLSVIETLFRYLKSLNEEKKAIKYK